MPQLKKIRKGSIHISRHPRNVCPESNLLCQPLQKRQAVKRQRDIGLGLFRRFDDEFILYFISEYLDVQSLVRLSKCSYYFYVLTTLDSQWRQRVVEANLSVSDFRGSWRATFFGRDTVANAELFWKRPPIYSDAIYFPFAFANLDHTLAPWVYGAAETVPRLDVVSDTQRVETLMRENKPFVLQNVVKSWPAASLWTPSYLETAFGDRKFQVDAVSLTIGEFSKLLQRSGDEKVDENPPYLFSPIGEALALDYSVPEPFQEDLFSLMGKDRRPDYRWIIIGATGSGSSLHKDPNGTSAFNAVIRGRKKWIMLPPSVTPPGVILNGDQSEVTSTVSVVEWLFHYYSHVSEQTPRFHLEAICEEGEIMFVPSGWWHCVLNIPPADGAEDFDVHVALTQNFVDKYNLKSVLSFLDEKPDQISGIGQHDGKLFAADFKASLKAKFPHYLHVPEEEQVKTLKFNGTAPFKFRFLESASPTST